MKIGGYEMTWPPDRWPVPKKTRHQSFVKTYESGVFFDWGMFVIGGEVILEWDWLPVEEFNRLSEIFELSATQLWEPDQADRLFHGTVTEGPFVTTAVVTGQTSGATGTISLVDEIYSYIEVTGTTGTFQRTEVIQDDSGTPKSATLTTVDQIKSYYVEIIDFAAKMLEVVGTDIFYRRQAKMRLLLMSEA
jgi:hypothetical protein